MTKQNPILYESFKVKAVGIWDESYRSYPERPDRYVGDVSFHNQQPIQ